jgi:hypothetical protein
MNGNTMCSETKPCGCADISIKQHWVVILDVSTPMLNSLTVRGQLIVQHDANISLAIHANLVNIKGGHLNMGNETNPFLGPLLQLFLHGDMYFHGKECNNPLDTYVSEFGCWKQIVVNGELSVHGRVVEVTRSLIQDAAKGNKVLYLEGGSLNGWRVGDDIIVSSTNSGGQPEYHTIAAISGSTITLASALAAARIGTTLLVEDASSGLSEVLDGRATVSLLTRNIEIRGGWDSVYDYLSGVGPALTDYGGTIRLYEAYEEAKAVAFIALPSFFLIFQKTRFYFLSLKRRNRDLKLFYFCINLKPFQSFSLRAGRAPWLAIHCTASIISPRATSLT